MQTRTSSPDRPSTRRVPLAVPLSALAVGTATALTAVLCGVSAVDAVLLAVGLTALVEATLARHLLAGREEGADERRTPRE